MMAKGADGISPFDGLNVEEVFSAVELLAERSTLEAAPFISAWHDGVDSLEASDVDRFYRDLAEEIGRSLVDGRTSHFTPPRLKKPLSRMLGASRTRDSGGVFRNTAQEMIEALQQCITIESPTSVSYLFPLLEFARKRDATICTLNYDTALEMAADSAGLTWSTGIKEWGQRGRFEIDDAEVRLLKLHGSITWTEGPHSDYQPSQIIETAWAKLPERHMKRYLLFGQREKLRVDGPFLDLLAEFRERLRRARVVVVVGYSFGDAHVNHYLAQWMRQTDRPHLIIIRPETGLTLWPREALGMSLQPTDAEIVTHLACPASEGFVKLGAALQTWLMSRENDATTICNTCGKTIAADREFCLWCHRAPGYTPS